MTEHAASASKGQFGLKLLYAVVPAQGKAFDSAASNVYPSGLQ